MTTKYSTELAISSLKQVMKDLRLSTFTPSGDRVEYAIKTLEKMMAEPEVYSTPDTAVDEIISHKWKICPLMKEICLEDNCKFWCENECLIVWIMKSMI